MTVATRTGRRAKLRKGPPPRVVNMATKAPPAHPPTDDRGSSGTVGWGGVMSSLAADYAPAWQLPRRWTTAENMRADPAVTAALAALTFPILGAALTVEGASDDPEDVKLAEFVEAGLANMTTDLSTHRMETLDSVGDGVAVFYTRYERREDDLWHLRKLKLLPNKSITEWNIDEDHGDPVGVTQTLPSGRPEVFTMDELLVFTHMRRGDSLLGRPALRAMYRPWFLIDKLSRIGAIAVERGASGTPWARYTGGSDTEARKLDRALQGLHAQERAYLRIDEDVPDWGIKGIEGATVDAVPLMEYQRRDLFLAPLAQFLALGSDGVGSMALSGDHSGFFMLALNFIAAEIEAVYNRYLIPRWIGYNWTVPSDRLPKVKHGAIDRRDVGAWTQAVAAMVQAGIPLPMDALAEEATRYLGITVPERETVAVGGTQDVNDPNAPEAEDAEAVNQSWRGVDLHGSHDQKTHGRKGGGGGGGSSGSKDRKAPERKAAPKAAPKTGGGGGAATSGDAGGSAAGSVKYHDSISKLRPADQERVKEAVALVESKLPPGALDGVEIRVGGMPAGASGSLAVLDPNTGVLRLNEKMWTKGDKRNGPDGPTFAEVNARDNQDSGFMVKGPYGDHRDVVVHELGHAVNANAWKMPGGVQDRQSWNKARNRDLMSRDIKSKDSHSVSDYGKSNGAEAFAEAFVAHVAGTHKSNRDVKWVGRAIKAMDYRAKAGKGFDQAKYWGMFEP